MHNRVFKRGFTMVELSLSIAFIAILSITVTLMITSTVSSYRRGITLNNINTTGMEIVDDIRASIQNSTARSVTNECATIYSGGESTGESTPAVTKQADAIKACVEDKAHNLVSIVRYERIKIGNNESEVPLFGALCTGSYSYIWNSGYFFNPEYGDENLGSFKATFTYNSRIETENNPKTISNFKLLKVMDENRAVCISSIYLNSDKTEARYAISKSGDNAISNHFDITGFHFIDEEPIDLLTGSNSLALYDLESDTPAESSSKRNLFYSVSFILGTVQGGINVQSAGNYCATPEGMDSEIENFDYCAINKFNFAAQATGG